MLKACFLPVLAIALLFSSCKKGKTVDDQGLIGTWELVEVAAAMSPAPFHPPANSELLKLTSSNYELYKEGTLVSAGSYTTEADTTVEQAVCLVFPEPYYTRRIDFTGIENAGKTFYRQSGNMLTFISGCYAYDTGYTKTYRRKKESHLQETTGD